MKTNFNIQKSVRNSRSISALQALKKLQGIGLVALFLLIGSLQVWGATYTKATSISAGDVVLLVCEREGKELSGISTTV